MTSCKTCGQRFTWSEKGCVCLWLCSVQSLFFVTSSATNNANPLHRTCSAAHVLHLGLHKANAAACTKLLQLKNPRETHKLGTASQHCHWLMQILSASYQLMPYLECIIAGLDIPPHKRPRALLGPCLAAKMHCNAVSTFSSWITNSDCNHDLKNFTAEHSTPGR